MCRCIAEENEKIRVKNAQIILVRNGDVVVPCVATEKINKSMSDRIPLLPMRFCPFCGEALK